MLDKYEFVDLARKVVGVGSVGTRCWVALFVGRDNSDPLFLQVKEAEAAVGEPFLGASEYAQHGQRVVEGQRLMQGASDIFLGWDTFEGDDGVTRDFYLRQLWDWKFSVDVDAMSPEGLGIYAQICGWTLARAHARSGDAIAMGSYLGGGDRFDRAMCDFADRLRRSERAGLRIPDPGHRRWPYRGHQRGLSARPRRSAPSDPSGPVQRIPTG